MDTTIPKYVLVEDYIRQQIKTGEITDKLPGERTLAAELGYSYMTIRKAIENLVNEGVLYKIPTKGTYVADGKQRHARTRSIGYFLDSSIESGLTSPYYSLIFNALEKEAARHDYTLLYFTDSESVKLKKILKKVDGVIASCFNRVEEYIQRIKELVPVVVIDNSAADKSIPSVIIDNFSALTQTVDYLSGIGHQRIGFMTGLEDSDVGKNRTEGYRAGLARHELAFDESLVFRGNYSFASGINGARYFIGLPKPPTAIVCANDSMALGHDQAQRTRPEGTRRFQHYRFRRHRGGEPGYSAADHRRRAGRRNCEAGFRVIEGPDRGSAFDDAAHRPAGRPRRTQVLRAAPGKDRRLRLNPGPVDGRHGREDGPPCHRWA